MSTTPIETIEEVYRAHRISVRLFDHWSARVTNVRGKVAPIDARASCEEGADACLARAREAVDRYIAFLGG